MFMPSMIPALGEGTVLIAGTSGATTGWQQFAFGTIIPDPFLVLGDECTAITTSDSTPDIATIDFQNGSLPADFWDTVIISGVFVGGQDSQLWDRVADNFSHLGNVGGNTRWQSLTVVNANDLMIDGNSYIISIGKAAPLPGTALSLIAGDVLPFRGYDVDVPMGALTPKDFNGRILGSIRNDNLIPNFQIGYESGEGVVPNTDAAFIQMTLDGDFGVGSVQQVYPRASGAYVAGPPSIWTYPPDTPMINTRTYIATFT